MLKTNKSTTITGQSTIDGQTVMSFSANLGQDSSSNNSNQSVIDYALYEANKAAVRKDAADFQAKVYDEEDKLASDTDTTE
ncbi:hypothetical protein C5Z25_01505 [Lactobacillus sp. CBA3605]|uniref:hypothetical protein n=1 Tax=Lactobacillus sp. CBA3605 TaxID=2099788 RepID=UPI000CFB8C1E|nr:hypothetical protein [Lactobacillus sp. CBA3605]AVK60525.1 hypothetical protein C5Z25_01505 [Lactobacillus sp. CBA3605]